VSGFVNEMRKKSPATIQKWVDSIAVDDDTCSSPKTIIEEEIANCDHNELKIEEEASTSGANENLKEKFSEICNKLTVNAKKLELKNLITKKLKIDLSENPPMEHKNDEIIHEKEEDETTKHEPELEILQEEDETACDAETESNKLSVQRSHIGVLGRSSSENPNPTSSRNRRLTDIGRSFSVAHDNELPTAENSSENLIYDADEDISITIPSLNTSPSIISNNTNPSLSNSQLVGGKSSLSLMRPVREHTVSEGHQSPQIQPKNPLLRDSSFQVSFEL
jgi:hypothetical protein